MDSIPPEKAPERAEDLRRMLEDATREVAFRLRLPWKVGELYEAGKQAAAAAWKEWSHSTLGLPREEFLGLRMGQAIEAAGKTMHAQAAADSKKRPPSEQQIETALKAFSAEQWKILVGSMDQVDVETLRNYLRQNTDKSKQSFGARKVERIEANAIMRSTELWRSSEGPTKLDPVSDAYWAVFWDEEASFLNIQGGGHATTGRSLDEAASERNTAKRLSKRDEIADHDMPVTAYKVKQWRKRAKELPFEDFDGDFLTYLVTIYYPEAYKSYLRRKGSKNT
jgi:hypothetical protein